MKDVASLDATLGRVSLQMASTLDLDEVLGEITRGLVRDLEAAMARVWLIRKGDPQYLHLVASAGLSERLDGSHGRVPVGEQKIGEIAASRAAVCSNELLGDPRFVDKEWIRANGLLTFGGYPLVFDSEVLGVLAMFARRPLTDADRQRLRAL